MPSSLATGPTLGSTGLGSDFEELPATLGIIPQVIVYQKDEMTLVLQEEVALEAQSHGWPDAQASRSRQRARERPRE